MSALLLALVLAAAPDPCEPVEPSSRPDPAAATAYRRVGDEEMASGARATAAAAYRMAAASALFQPASDHLFTPAGFTGDPIVINLGRINKHPALHEKGIQHGEGGRLVDCAAKVARTQAEG